MRKRGLVRADEGSAEQNSSHFRCYLTALLFCRCYSQGNVAIDCARVLLSPVSRLEHTDISDSALGELTSASVSSVHMVGRRGCAQSAFSIGELREMAAGVEGVRVRLDPDEFRRSENDASLKEIEVSRSREPMRAHCPLNWIVLECMQSLPNNCLFFFSATPRNVCHVSAGST